MLGIDSKRVALHVNHVIRTYRANALYNRCRLAMDVPQNPTEAR
jgi:hypothetical protein